MSSVVRCLENLPGVGHLIALMYGCCGTRQKDMAERAAIKATVGIAFFFINFPAEVVDEMWRTRSYKLLSSGLTLRPGWMRNHRQRILRNICLPGSHQSATYHMAKKLRSVPMVEGWSRCQRISIDAQLYGGIRFLDLRLMTYNNEVWCHHNLVICVKLRDVLECVRDFINENASEIVFLYMTNDGKPLEWASVNTLVNEILQPSRLVFEHMRDMLIGDIIDQGKQVVIFGVPHVAYSWTKLQWKWPNKAWPRDLQDDLEDTLSEMGMYRPTNMYWYKAECTPNAHMVTRSVGGLPGALVCKCAAEKFDFVEDMAAAVNHCVHETLKGIVTLPFNVLSTDYVHDDIVARIIELNETVPVGQNLSISQQQHQSGYYDMTSPGANESFLETRTITSVSTNRSFDIHPPVMTPIEIRETCT